MRFGWLDQGRFFESFDKPAHGTVWLLLDDLLAFVRLEAIFGDESFQDLFSLVDDPATGTHDAFFKLFLAWGQLCWRVCVWWRFCFHIFVVYGVYGQAGLALGSRRDNIRSAKTGMECRRSSNSRWRCAGVGIGAVWRLVYWCIRQRCSLS